MYVRAIQNSLDPRTGQSFRLPESEERAIKSKHLSAINSFANRTVNPDEISVRGMYVCNTQRDYYYSRFKRSALDELAELLPGAPNMMAHNYSTQPVARFFDARVVRIEDDTLPKGDQYWLQALYYMPTDAEGEAVRTRIDLGIYKEVSVGWRCAAADCSVCSRPIYACEHIPGEIYQKHGICEYQFSGITSALEVSHVFRGGQKDTSTFVPTGYSEVGGRIKDVGAIRLRSALVEPGDLDSRLIRGVKLANLDALARMRREQSVEDWLAGELAQRAVGLGCIFGQRGERGTTQALVMSRERFKTSKRAARWVRDNDFRADRQSDTERDFIFEQFDSRLAEDGSFYDIKLEDGVSARSCRIKQEPSEDSRGAGDTHSVESWLEREAAAK